MNYQPASEQSYPIAFIVIPTFVGALVWLCTILAWLQ